MKQSYILQHNTLIPAPIVTPAVTVQKSDPVLTITDAWIAFWLIVGFDCFLLVGR